MNRAPFVAGSDTSEAAADQIEPVRKPLSEVVHEFIDERGPFGATTNEVELALNMRHQTASARVRELTKARRIKKTDMRRETDSGRSAVVYVAA